MNWKCIPAAVLLVASTVLATPRTSPASDKAEIAATVHRFVDNLDEKTASTALALCDSPASIIDEFPPYAWQGATACADWWKAYLAYNSQNGITPGDVTLGEPWHVDITGDHAYYVAPISYSSTQQAKTTKESASFAVVLRRTPAGWRITAWAYSRQ